jgi:RNA polymerase sigma-70 factor (ECF subfamily)
MNESSSPRHRLSEPETWLAQHGDALYRYAYFRLRDRAQAEDLVQETLIAALQARPGFAGRASERTWLIGILKNKLVDYLRKSVRERPLADVAATETEIDALFDAGDADHWKKPPAAWANPAQALEQKQFWKIFMECFEALPARQAQAFSLCELEGLEGEEACKVLGIATTNLWVMMHRARLRLRECLETHWFSRGAE